MHIEKERLAERKILHSMLAGTGYTPLKFNKILGQLQSPKRTVFTFASCKSS